MDFYYSPATTACRSVLLTAKAIGLELNKITFHLAHGDHLNFEFVKLNPQHIIPTLNDNGLVLWESRAIMIYLVEQYAKTDSLYPKCPEKQALINQRLYFDMGTMYKSFADYFYPQILHKKPADPEKLKEVETAFGYLDTFLEGQTYLAGDTLTIADIALVSTIMIFDFKYFDFSKWLNVSRWYENAKQVVPGFAEEWEELVMDPGIHYGAGFALFDYPL